MHHSEVTLIAIDTPALMEAKGLWNELINHPLLVTVIFKHAYRDLSNPRLVLFVPVKCEKYLHDEESIAELQKKIREEYATLLNLFSSPALRHKVVAAITPVQTVGTVEFAYIEAEDDVPHFYFHRTRDDILYDPKDTDQPLRYLMLFLIKLHYENRVQSWGIFSFLREMFGLDDHLKDAAYQFALNCKNTVDGFEIIQGHEWLRP